MLPSSGVFLHTYNGRSPKNEIMSVELILCILPKHEFSLGMSLGCTEGGVLCLI